MAESYPALRAGNKVTGALLESMLPKTVRKLSDTPRTSTTLSDDPELQFAVEANAVYRIEGVIWISSTDNATDIILDWTVPTGADGTWSGIGQPTTATSTDGTVRTHGTSIDANRNYGATSAATLSVVVNTILIVGSTAGTYALSWGANAASGTVSVLTDSHLSFTRIG